MAPADPELERPQVAGNEPRLVRPPGRTLKTSVVVAALAALWLAMLLLGAGAVDREILLALYAGSRPLLVSMARGFTALGEWPVVVLVSVAAAAWLVYRREASAALLLLAGTLLARLLVILQKAGFDRLRPDEHLRLVEVSSKSFPSAHSANSMLVYPLCAVLLAPPRWRLPVVAATILLALCIGISRVLLGVHWPSDVVGGWAFGGLAALAILRVHARSHSSS
jgi:undecaprenyl-diphosphatase